MPLSARWMIGKGIRGKRRGEGMRARTKFLAQVLLAMGTAFVLKYLLKVPEMRLPGIKTILNLVCGTSRSQLLLS